MLFRSDDTRGVLLVDPAAPSTLTAFSEWQTRRFHAAHGYLYQQTSADQWQRFELPLQPGLARRLPPPPQQWRLEDVTGTASTVVEAWQLPPNDPYGSNGDWKVRVGRAPVAPLTNWGWSSIHVSCRGLELDGDMIVTGAGHVIDVTDPARPRVQPHLRMAGYEDYTRVAAVNGSFVFAGGSRGLEILPAAHRPQLDFPVAEFPTQVDGGVIAIGDFVYFLAPDGIARIAGDAPDGTDRKSTRLNSSHYS